MTTFNIDAKEIRDMAIEIRGQACDEDTSEQVYITAIELTVQALLDNLGADDVRKAPKFSSNLREGHRLYGYTARQPVFANHAPHGVPPNDRD